MALVTKICIPQLSDQLITTEISKGLLFTNKIPNSNETKGELIGYDIYRPIPIIIRKNSNYKYNFMFNSPKYGAMMTRLNWIQRQHVIFINGEHFFQKTDNIKWIIVTTISVVIFLFTHFK